MNAKNGCCCGYKNRCYGLDKVTADEAAMKIISPAYAGDEGELNAMLGFLYQHAVLTERGETANAEVMRRIALDEMEHLSVLATLIARLGCAPVYTYLPSYPINYYSARSIGYTTEFTEMLAADIAAKKYSAARYKKMLAALRNPPVAAAIGKILEEELMHLTLLERMNAGERA